MDTGAAHVLVIDDDVEACNPVCEYLGQHDFRVTAVRTRQQMLEVIGREPIDLLLLEPRLRGSEGMLLTRSVREASKLPIVVLSRMTEEADRVMGLELGADDYVPKSCSPRELLARIRAVLRRCREMSAPSSTDKSVRAYRFCGWELNVRTRRLRNQGGMEVRISRGEFSLLSAFLAMPRRILTRDQLLDYSRMHSSEVYDRSIDVQIARLRRKIESDTASPRFIRTERGVGYFFDADVASLRS